MLKADMYKYGFGLVEPKREGGKLWPYDYLKINGRTPPAGYYTPKEISEFLELGYELHACSS